MFLRVRNVKKGLSVCVRLCVSVAKYFLSFPLDPLCQSSAVLYADNPWPLEPLSFNETKRRLTEPCLFIHVTS